MTDEPCTKTNCSAQMHPASEGHIDGPGELERRPDGEAQGAVDAVIHLDAVTLLPIGVSKPCPATTIAHLGFSRLSGVRVPCGHLAGHDGPHVHRVEWTDPLAKDGA